MLSLRFSVRSGRVEVACDASRAQHLHSLRSRLPSAVSLTQHSFDVDLDDLLVNLDELAAWPDDTDVQWQPELLRLVEGNAVDAEDLEERLRHLAASGSAVSPVQLPGGWLAPLTDFQVRDVQRLLELVHGANFSVPGAGKTRVALSLFAARAALGEVSRMLVVCPKSAFESWEVELATCLGADAPKLQIMNSASVPSAGVVLVNYERLPDARPALERWLKDAPALMVLDEAHRMKLGPRGAWGAACLALGPYAARRLILSGTPAPNGPEDLANLLAFVWPGRGRVAVRQALAGRDLREASLRLRPLFVRTTKAELDLPPVELTVRRLPLPPLHGDLYRALVGHASAHWLSGPDDDFESLGRIIMYLLMAATSPALLATGGSRYEPLDYRLPPLQPPSGSTLGQLLADLPLYELSPKYQECIGIVAANARLGRKTLVWSTFVRSLTTLQRLLHEYQPAVVHGGTSEREDELKRFRSDPRCMVLLSNAATLGEGVSLHRECHDAVYIDRDFAAGRFLQSLDRIHRLGLPPDVETRVTVLVADETIDELVEQRLAAKLRFMGGVLDDPAVTELADLSEEPVSTAGLDAADVRLLLRHLTSAAGSDVA